MLHRFYEVSKIIIAENALRILKEIRENIKAQAYLNSFSIFPIYTWLDNFLIECRRPRFDTGQNMSVSGVFISGRSKPLQLHQGFSPSQDECLDGLEF